MTKAWNELLDELRALGGTAENLCLKEGPFGRGLFVEDPAKPAELRIPECVLPDVDDIVFENNVFRVGPGSKLGARERAFVEKYEADFSWGAGGRAETEAFFDSVRALPEPVRVLLTNELAMGFLFDDTTPRAVQNRFLQARRIGYRGRNVVMPIMDLANYGHLTGYNTDDGIAMSGRFENEVLIRYSKCDSYTLFRGWGFASEEAEAFSIGINARTRFGKFVISMNHDQQQSEQRPWIPKLTVVGDEFRFSFLLLGSRRFPRLPKGIFLRVMKEAGHPDITEPFEFLQHANCLTFLKLVAALEGVDGAAARSIRTMALYQLQSLSYCFGIRDPYDAVPATSG